MVEPDVGNEVAALDLKWAGVVCEPWDIEWKLFEGTVPVVEEDIEHFLLDVSPLVSNSYADNRYDVC